MGLLKTIGSFLFGKDPAIFDDRGRVSHPISDQRLRDWNNRLAKNPMYDWHKHKGNQPALEPVDSNQPAPPLKNP